MTFPHIQTKSTNVTITPKIQNLLDQKLSPLGKLLGTKGDAHCEVEIDKVAEHQSGKIFRVEVNIVSNGKVFRADATEEQVEQAIDAVRNELKNEILRVNGRHMSLVRRGGQMLKNMLKFG